MNVNDRQEIEDARQVLEDMYPVEANYGSRCSLWSEGLRDDIISKTLYDKAKEYYGKLWNYVGD